MNNNELPAEFLRQMQGQLKDEFDAFVAALETEPPVSIRHNPAKVVSDNLPIDAPVPWHPDAHYLRERPVFTLDPAFHTGAYYVQEASSMILHEVLKQAVKSKGPLRILDLCAAPGGKSTLLASWMPEGSLLLSNEVIHSRVGILQNNLDLWGSFNTFTCSYDTEDFKGLSGFFDVVLVDAPCSGEGMFRKDTSARGEWSPEMVEVCTGRQQRIVEIAQRLVAPGGIFIYSTCTYNDSENVLNAQRIVEDGNMMEAKLEFPDEWGISRKSIGYQFYPHKVRGEGLYIAAFVQLQRNSFKDIPSRHFSRLYELSRSEAKNVASWLENGDEYMYFKAKDNRVSLAPVSLKHDLKVLDHHLPSGVWLKPVGQLKGKEFIPSQTLALSTAVSTQIPRIQLEKKEALQFLKKELNAVENEPKGWVLMCYNNQPMGWAKNLGNRINNYLPTESRIRMDIDV